MTGHDGYVAPADAHARRRRRGGPRRGRRRRRGRRGRGSPRPTVGTAGAGRARSTFYGEHQAGIVTPAQDRLHFVAFDVITSDRDELVELLQAVDGGRGPDDRRPATPVPIGAVDGVPEAPPDDTGEALGLPPSQLTLTSASGRRCSATRRAGTGSASPTAPGARWPTCRTSPATRSEPEISGGDICVQACANDPQVAVHAVRNLARIGFGAVSVRWSQLGLRPYLVDVAPAQQTPRNLMGFKDGTANLKAEEHRPAARAPVGRSRATVRPGWTVARTSSPARSGCWSRPGTAPRWASRRRSSGGTRARAPRSARPASSTSPTSPPRGADGEPLIGRGRARPAGPPGLQRRRPAAAPGLQLRRRLGRARPARRRAVLHRLPARSAHASSCPVQRQLASQDILNEYIRHVSSGLFACPPGRTRRRRLLGPHAVRLNRRGSASGDTGRTGGPAPASCGWPPPIDAPTGGGAGGPDSAVPRSPRPGRARPSPPERERRRADASRGGAARRGLRPGTSSRGCPGAAAGWSPRPPRGRAAGRAAVRAGSRMLAVAGQEVADGEREVVVRAR